MKSKIIFTLQLTIAGLFGLELVNYFTDGSKVIGWLILAFLVVTGLSIFSFKKVEDNDNNGH